jgi:hypothetical protein
MQVVSIGARAGSRTHDTPWLQDGICPSYIQEEEERRRRHPAQELRASSSQAPATPMLVQLELLDHLLVLLPSCSDRQQTAFS